MIKYPMTVQGARALEEELAHLTKVRRPALSQAIAEARELGDLKENAEYHAAREQQSFIEGRIQELEYTLSHCQIIEVGKLKAGSKVVFGATVELVDVESDATVIYMIVGDLEADLKQQRISISSPIARALIGKHEGDAITILAPGGNREYEITAVRYID